jgi:[acyl-carrier-protein] S-malonyltransferase
VIEVKFAMVFPGQGSQSVGMLAGYGDMPAIRETLAEASDVLKQDLSKLIAEGPAEELNSTVNTQPVMVTAGICAWRAWRESGGAEPALLAGHSLGEYTALVAAGAISFADCLPLVRLRGRARWRPSWAWMTKRYRGRARKPHRAMSARR